jgi:hypothetical protein
MFASPGELGGQPLPVTAYGCSPAAKKPAPPKHTRKREIIRDSSGVGHQTKANTLGCHDGLQKGFFRCLDAGSRAAKKAPRDRAEHFGGT